MKIQRTAILAVFVLLGGFTDAFACKCREQPLSNYFDSADWVFIGDVNSENIETGEDGVESRVIEFGLPGGTYKKPQSGASPALISVHTATHSASCGIDPDSNTLYVVFASTEADGKVSTHSCAGTRPLLSSLDENDEMFQGIPGKFLARQLNALAGLEAQHN